tara:strand:+ start:862 stop:1854 length:993 start_codon:yes stop_codon:yes gene_type:complete
MPPTMSKPLIDQDVYIDLLDEDKPISEQKFVCLSFVSPEKIIKQREEYLFEKFVEQWQFSKEVEKYNQFLGFLGFKYNLDVEKLNQDFSDFLNEEKDNLKTSVGDDFKNYLDVNEEKLIEEYNLKHGFQTSVRGVKVRGTFSSQQEAELRCKMLRETDPNHDVYVGPVGVWMPFHPDAYKTGRVEHLEKELNELMHEKNKNEAKAKQEFDARVKESKRKAIEDNIKKATENKNKLSQTINKDGELVGVKEMNTQMQFLGEEATVEEVRSELFEGDNIVLDKDTDHGLSQLTNQPFEQEPTCENMNEPLEETSETSEKSEEEEDDVLEVGV